MAPRTPVKKKTKSLSRAKSPSRGKVPSNRRCQKCPHKPLRVECVHTKMGRAHLRVDSHSPSTPVHSASSPCVATSTPTPAPLINSAAGTLAPKSASPAYNFMVDPFAFQMAHPMGISLANRIQDGLDAELSGAIADRTQLIAPQLSAVSVAPSSTSTPPSTPVPATQLSSLRLSSNTRSSRTRITADNAIYGFVEGAKQGNGDYAIVRTKKLRPAQADAREAGKRFHRGMQDLIVRVENLSKETGAWVYLGGQHVNGTKGYTNYASPRLRRDAKKELTVLQNHFNSMTSALITSRRREAVELSIALEKANKERRAAQVSIAEFQAALDTPELTEALTKDAFIAKLRALVASANSPDV